MKHWLYYILATISTLMLFSCSEDEQGQDVYADEPIEIAVNTSWQCGRGIGTSRAFIDPVGDDASKYPYSLYPQRFLIYITDGTSFNRPTDLPEFYIVNQSAAEDDNYDHDRLYVEYHDVYSHLGKLQPKPYYSKSQMQKLNIEAGTMMAPYEYNTVDAADLASTISTNSVYPRMWQASDIPTFGYYDFLTTGGEACDVYDPLFHGRYRIERNHLFLDLGHATALLRLHFKVHPDYDKVRKIVLRKVKITKINEADADYTFTLNASQTIDTSLPDAETPGFLLTTSKQLYAYGYMKPSHSYDDDGTKVLADVLTTGPLYPWTGAVSANTQLTLECTYDIYENDIVKGLPDPSVNGYNDALTTKLNDNLSAHCTRRSVTATNRFTFGTATATTGNTITKIQAGHYYDLEITINPDYLYVLSEHDNKHLTIQ